MFISLELYDFSSAFLLLCQRSNGISSSGRDKKFHEIFVEKRVPRTIRIILLSVLGNSSTCITKTHFFPMCAQNSPSVSHRLRNVHDRFP